MNLAWAKEWVGNWSPEGAEKVAASYADDAVFHDYPTGHITRGKDIGKMWMGMKRPDAGKHTFVVTGYIGTIHFTSTDGTASLPPNYTFTAADKGVHTFTRLVLRRKGTQKITLTDTLNSSLTGSVIENVL